MPSILKILDFKIKSDIIFSVSETDFCIKLEISKIEIDGLDYKISRIVSSGIGVPILSLIFFAT